ncbi:BTB/POZ domain-containing protein 1-like isoform X1 [Schistocerca gregaria]|uniref:BTB/POZ domain-containing protein 1-like isoform X1 n=2 Tax=Schistocerca gregaria TaxID=7010 RepID=UPI00211F0222|nr:BTB/POZ domain-containing protein 1-like isoform X1 [Schistocerca gregaria]
MRPLEKLLNRKLHRYVNHPARTEAKFLTSKMCSAISTTPLLAKRCESTLPNEADSDVTFLVGPDGCRVPGHRSVLAAANPVFRCMFEGPLACGHSVTVPDVPWRGFANLLRFLYQEPVQLPTVQTALATLYAAHKYQCHGLQLLCTQHLAASLDASCVLEVFSNVRVYCDSFGCVTKAAPEGDEWAPSAPPSDGDEQTSLAAEAGQAAGLEAVVAGYAALRRRCLQFCDERADDVLSLEQLEDLSRDELLEVVTRDSFAPSSEALLFAAVVRWARCRCLCSQRPLCADDLRDEAGDALLYAVRYPFMSLQDFVDGPMRSGLISGEDAVFFLDRINRPGAPPAGPPPKHLEAHLDKMSAPRVGGGRGRRKSSSPVGRHAGATATGCLQRKKTAKKDKKHKGKDTDADGFSFYFLSCLSCILD